MKFDPQKPYCKFHLKTRKVVLHILQTMFNIQTSVPKRKKYTEIWKNGKITTERFRDQSMDKGYGPTNYLGRDNSLFSYKDWPQTRFPPKRENCLDTCFFDEENTIWVTIIVTPLKTDVIVRHG